MAQPTAAPPPSRRPPGRHRENGASAAPTRSRSQIRRYAALDLGTNNCRLLIAQPNAEGFTVVDAFSRIVRLGEGLAATGRLSEAAVDRALSALSICADKLRRRNVTLVRSVATEACRRAENGRAFVDRVYAETGIALEIITPEQEARLAVMGCHALLEPGDGRALIFDIGGGSTELVLIETGASDGQPRVIDWFSAPWGVVSLTESGPIDQHEHEDGRFYAYGAMRQRVADAFRPFAERLDSHDDGTPGRLLGTSGTVTTLASVHLGLPRYDRRAVDGLVVPTPAMRAISGRLAGMSLSERMRLPCIGQERADLVVAGCAILEGILDLWPADRIGVADRGIREGILRSLMARDGHRW
jgi:exopolyphosphatase/guanosine-5'-triphosphate,3'-diphosphate pyrophosphatase